MELFEDHITEWDALAPIKWPGGSFLGVIFAIFVLVTVTTPIVPCQFKVSEPLSISLPQRILSTSLPLSSVLLLHLLLVQEEDNYKQEIVQLTISHVSYLGIQSRIRSEKHFPILTHFIKITGLKYFWKIFCQKIVYFYWL